jgi:hypothetical protein
MIYDSDGDSTACCGKEPNHLDEPLCSKYDPDHKRMGWHLNPREKPEKVNMIRIINALTVT